MKNLILILIMSLLALNLNAQTNGNEKQFEIGEIIPLLKVAVSQN